MISSSPGGVTVHPQLITTGLLEEGELALGKQATEVMTQWPRGLPPLKWPTACTLGSYIHITI